MTGGRIAARLSAARAAGRPLVNGWMMAPEPAFLEAIAGQGWDCITVDLQHGQIDATAARALARCAEGLGMPLMARLASDDPTHVGRLLDDGFEGLICPMVNSAAQAQALAGACHYPPVGQRSFGPVRAAALRGADYWQKIGADLVILAMIETRAALAALPQILAVEGIAGVYVGPADLGLSLTGAPTREPEAPDLIATVDGIRRTAQAAGRLAAIHNTTAAHTARMAAAGWNVVTGPSDLGLIATASAEALRVIRAATDERTPT